MTALLARARAFFQSGPPAPPYAVCVSCRRPGYETALYRPANQSVWQCARCLGDAS